MKLYYSIAFILIIIPTTIFSQVNVDLAKRKRFQEASAKQEASVNYSYENGLTMLKLAKDDYEKALSYTIMAESKYKDADFLKAISLFELGEQHIKKTDDFNIKLRILTNQVSTYRRAGLIVNSDQKWKELQKATEKIDHYNKYYILYSTEAKIYDIDNEPCKAIAPRKKYHELIQNSDNGQEFKTRFAFSTLAQLAYSYIGCNKYNEARSTVKELEQIRTKIDDKGDLLLLEFLMLNKALIAVKDQQKETARKYFDSATTTAAKTNNNTVIRVILKERLNANLDPVEEQLKFAQQIHKITESETTVTKSLAIKESNKTIALLEEKKLREKSLTTALVLSTILFTGFIIWYRNKNRKSKAAYLKIIEDLKTNQETKTNEIAAVSQEEKIEFSITNETEIEILKNLKTFEAKKQFTKKGISTAQMAVLLKTNTKYLNHILKKYRNSDFYHYINTCRINYIVKELHDDPQLLQYKIAVLSELCGYNTHSQFTSIFKSQKGISPSQYIHLLLIDQKKNKNSIND